MKLRRRIPRDTYSLSIFMLVGLAMALAFLLYPRASQILGEEGDDLQTIVYWVPVAASESEKAAIEEFERRNENYRVTIGSSTVRDATGDPTRFLLGVAGHAPPDLIFFDRFAIVEWASRGAFQDLLPFIERDQHLPNAIREENYFAPVWEESTYQDGVYAVGNGVDTRALYYVKDALIRAGFVYRDNDPEVIAGRVEPGEARPPKTWEELCNKILHVNADVSADGIVHLRSHTRRQAINEDIPPDAMPDLRGTGVREGDVAVVISGTRVFRGRIARILDSESFQIDLSREQHPNLRSIPAENTGSAEIKVFDQDSYVVRLTRFDPATGEMTDAGFIPMFGNSWLYIFGWLNGAEFMSEDGTRSLLDSHEVVAALQYVTDIYDSLGGYTATTRFQSAGQSANPAFDLMLRGSVPLRIDGDWFLQTILEFRPRLDFGVVPAPIPERRLRAGAQPVGWMGGWSYAIPSTAKNKEGGWKLMKWLCSVEARQIMEDYEASLKRASGRAHFPRLQPDKRVLEWVTAKYVVQNPAISANFVEAFETFSDLLPYSRYRPVTPVGQKLWTEHVRAVEAAASHTKTPYDALYYGSRQVQNALDIALNPPTGPLIRWPWIIGIYAASVILIGLVLIALQEYRRRTYGGYRRGWFEGFVCASPWITGFLVFGAGPIIFSIVISFCYYDVLNPARFIGLTNYINLLGRHFDPMLEQNSWNDPILWKSLGNTLFMVLSVPLSIIFGLALALLLDSKVRGMHFFRTLFYMPAIVPAVAIFILWIWMFEPSRGIINISLQALGWQHPPAWLQDPIWAKPALIIMGLWGVGASTLIWLAGLKDIPETLYEAASIDGANRTQRFFHVTIPLLSPYILFNMIMGMIGVFQIFEAAYIMTDGGPADSTRFYAYKLFDEAFRYLNMGRASAMAWILFVIVLLITLLQLHFSRKWVHYGDSQ